MDKKFLIIFVIVLVLLAAGYWYWKSVQMTPTPEEINLGNVGDSVEAITDSATQGVLPSLAVPDVNPVTKTNPYSELKTNPFR